MSNSKKDWAIISSRCCNPFEEINHPKSSKTLRNVTNWMCSLELEIKSGMKICDKCRKRIYETYKGDEEKEVLPCSSQSLDDSFTDNQLSLDYLNKSLELIGESPFKKKKTNEPSYTTKKLDKIKLSLEKSLLPETNQEEQPIETLQESEIIKQLKEKFAITTKRSEKMTILSVLPQSWSIKKIQDEFGTSNYMARAVKKLVKEKGILSTPNPKSGRTLNEDMAELVKDFYNSDDVSRMMPGKKDYVTIKNNDGKCYVQKRLVLANLKEIHQLFKEKFPGSEIGFSKFCELRPKNCVLAGKSGTHTVCVCTLHQNIKLMMNGAKMQNFVVDETALKSYHSCLAKIMCNPPSEHCYMNTCKECPGVTQFKELLHNKFDEEMIDEVTYKKWVTVDRCLMETVVKNTDDFIDDFLETLIKVKTHSFISNQQKDYYNEIKENLPEGHIVANCDFAENYSFIIQDEIQSFHWTTTQATIHPFIVYYKWEGKLKNLQYVFISDCLEHNTVAFYVFQKKLLEILKGTLPFDLKKITYFSDGSAAQYKNRKNFYNLCLHKQDFGIEAEWQFFATSHGKSACDGLGGTVKRLAAKASLQRPYDQQILTPRQLYDFATENISSIDFELCTTQDYEDTKEILLPRHNESKAIVGTQHFHSFSPISENQIIVKPYYFSQDESLQCVTEVHQLTPTDLENITSGFVTVAYDNAWWLGCIEQKEDNMYKINFLHPKGPARSFFYPQPRDILVVPGFTLLQKVNPSTPTGRTYTLSADEMKLSSLALKKSVKILQ